MKKVIFPIPESFITNKTEDLSYNTYKQITNNVYAFNNVQHSNDSIELLYSLAISSKNNDKHKAYELFKECKSRINDGSNVSLDLFYDVFINLAILATELNNSSEEIALYYEKLISIFPDRAEPYYYWAIYCNKIKHFQKALELLLSASQLTYDKSKIKYPETNYRAYGKFLYDEMSVTYYWLGKYNKSKELIEKIINDNDFVNERERIKRNLDYCNEKLNCVI